tara:strand:- start:4 stop:921 length:918 start_codon:yes stop_codon:yes gene_type:complete
MNFSNGRCGYTHFLDMHGHIIDDMIFAVKSDIEVLGVPNASMVPVMLDHFTSELPEDGSITIDNLSDSTSILALQGPASPDILAEVIGEGNAVGRFACQEITDNDLAISGWIQGTGYTGERGYEIFVNDQQAPILWNALLEAGSSHGLVPVGLGARDTLRLEKGYLLSGQDFLWPGLGAFAEEPLPEDFLTRDTAETAVPFGLDLEHEFIGKHQVLASIDSGDRWHGLECLERGPAPRPGHVVLSSDDDDADVVGRVTSGAPSPSKQRTGIAMAYLRGVNPGDEVWIQASPRRRVRALVMRPPFI